MNCSRNAEGMYVSIANTNAKKILALLEEMPREERRRLIRVLAQLQSASDLTIHRNQRREIWERHEREEYLND
jgi:Mg/Co/Ni transporter MgtE